MPHPLLDDPWVAAKIDAAVERHGKAWTGEQIEAFREQMAHTLATHRLARRVLEAAHPSSIDRSGECVVGGRIEPEAGAPPAGRKAGNQ